jgi:poly-gamma-glutamate capsule biosynthesis protein CapA/YwtB (metallophosphatase superfamily)
MDGEEAVTMSTITIAAVGDIMMWREQVAAARLAGSTGHSFDEVFRDVAPIFKKCDLVIGNLETTLAGRGAPHQSRNPKNGFPRFSCPDELVPALRRAGFHVLTTANNHCMDHGFPGLRRTLSILDRHEIKHTGTSRSARERNRKLVISVNGIDVGILAYTYGTNGIRLPASKRWAVNRILAPRILRDIRRLRQKADLVVVSLHFGREFRRRPREGQVKLVQRLLRGGADIILGSHPHVVQPTLVTRVRRPDGSIRRCVAVYSLGNFVSRRMWRNPWTQRGLILKVSVEKRQGGRARIVGVRSIPTWTRARAASGRPAYSVVPLVGVRPVRPTGLAD